jgi:DNA polymerase-3 subunit alpha
VSDSFVHLHVHTEYSMLDGAAKVGPLFETAETLGMSAVAITDHGNMFGAAEFWDRSKQHPSVKPIIGIEAYVAPGSRYHKKPIFWGEAKQRSSDESGEGGDVSGSGAFTHMTMLAATLTGLGNLYKLSSRASLEGHYRKPRMDRELIAEHAKGIVATTGCPSGEVQTRLRLGHVTEALQAASDYRDMFDDGRFFVELMDHGLPIERSVRNGLLDIAAKLGLPIVATNDSHYVTPDQSEAHAALLCVQTGKTLTDPSRFKFDGDGYYLKSAEEMRAYWDKEVPGAADNTLAIADQVESYADAFEYKDRMPIFPGVLSPLKAAAREVLNAGVVPDSEIASVARLGPLMLRVETPGAVTKLRDSFVAHPGTRPVCLTLCDPGDEMLLLASDYPVDISGELLRKLTSIDGMTVA